MTEVLFYHLQNMTLEKRAAAAAREVARARLAGGGAVDIGGARDALDAHLWTYRDDSFLPHATWRVADVKDQPIVLAVGDGNPNAANVRFLVDNAVLPADADSYERMVLVFNGDDPDALAAARSAWTDCKTRGFDVTYWQADEHGRWQRRG